MSIYSGALNFRFGATQQMAGESLIYTDTDGTVTHVGSAVFEELDATKNQIRQSHFSTNKVVYSLLVRRSDLPVGFTPRKNDRIKRSGTGEQLIVQQPDGKQLYGFSDAQNPTFIRIIAVVA